MSDAQANPLRWTPVWVVLLVTMWPLPAAAQALLTLGALVGLGWLLLRRSNQGAALLSGPAWALTGVMFCAYWLPEVIAATDAGRAGQAWQGIALDLRMLPLLWLAATAVSVETGRHRVFAGIAWLALVWAIDGLLTVTTGRSVLQGLYAQGAGAMEAVGIGLSRYAPANDVWTNGETWLALACLSPFALDWAARKAFAAWLAVAMVFVAVIALSMAPAAWVAFGCVLALALVRQFNRRHAFAVLVVAGIGVGLWAWAVQSQARSPMGADVQASAPAQASTLIEGRAWRDALCVIRSHPINGVGIDGVALAARHCPAATVVSREGEARGLPLLLAIPAETGVIGLLLWLAGLALAWRAWRYADATARARAWPALQALAAMLFPLNASPPVYASLWGSAILLLAGLYAGALWGRIDPEPARQS